MIVKYVVKDEHTLGYIFDEESKFMGVLSSDKDGHNPKNGSVCTFGANIKPATEGDFKKFRVKVPPDFKAGM